MTYETARAAIDNLNSRIREEQEFGRTLKIGVATEAEFAAHFDRKAALAREGNAAGYIRIFDGSFKLDLKKVA